MQGFRNYKPGAPKNPLAIFFSLDVRCFLHCDEKFLHLWWKTGSKKKNISHSKTSQTNCSEHRMICSRFLSDYLEIFSAPPRKSLDNHSKTSHRSSCFPHSFFEVVEYENYYFSWLWREVWWIWGGRDLETALQGFFLTGVLEFTGVLWHWSYLQWLEVVDEFLG